MTKEGKTEERKERNREFTKHGRNSEQRCEWHRCKEKIYWANQRTKFKEEVRKILV